MKLIRNLGTRKYKTGKNRTSWGLFKCSYCKEKVERILGAGKRCKSCGCAKAVLTATGNTKHGDASKKKRNIIMYIIYG